MASSITKGQTFEGPGLSPFKRIITILAIISVTVLVLWIAIHQGISALGSTIAAILFIGGFIYYLRIIAPVPFTIHVEPEALIKRSRNGQAIEISWTDLTRVKEEFFHSGKRIGITVYRKVTSQEQKPKAWAVYRDDITDIDGFAEALKKAVPPTCEWQSETVHE